MSILRKFGNVSGVLDQDFHIIEIKTNSISYISEINVSFRIPVGQTKLTKPFGVSRLIVIKRRLSEIDFSLNTFADLNLSDIVFDKFIYDYDGFHAQFNQLKSDKNEAICVVLYPQYDTDVSIKKLYSSLTVLGTSITENLGLTTI